LAKTGLLADIIYAVNRIYQGRIGLTTIGGESNGRENYTEGIVKADVTFQAVQATRDPETIILVEYAFLVQELGFCDNEDTITRSSLTQAVQGFDDALLCLGVVTVPSYRDTEKTYPHRKEYRFKGLPKDAFHIACIAHRTRLGNVLRSPGINMIEKDVLHQRRANLQAAQESYLEKQTAILSV
jgi:hypothetical protein